MKKSFLKQICAESYSKLNEIAIYDVLLISLQNTKQNTTQTKQEPDSLTQANAILVFSANLELSKWSYQGSSWTV
jgi:hypothetical protein